MSVSLEPEYPEKPPTCLSYLTILYPVHLVMSEIRTHNLTVIVTDCTGSCKSYYNTITSTKAKISERQIILKSFRRKKTKGTGYLKLTKVIYSCGRRTLVVIIITCT